MEEWTQKDRETFEVTRAILIREAEKRGIEIPVWEMIILTYRAMDITDERIADMPDVQCRSRKTVMEVVKRNREKWGY